MPKKKEPWFLYIVRCANDAFYTGITKDIAHRIDMHNSGKGAKYTKMYGPCELVYFEKLKSIQDAMKREVAVKRLSRLKKEEMVDGFPAKKVRAAVLAK